MVQGMRRYAAWCARIRRAVASRRHHPLSMTSTPATATYCVRVAAHFSSGSASREHIMTWSFALGSTCFLIAPFPGYADLVGMTVVAMTFFVGSLFFTAGGAMQTWLSAAERHVSSAGR